MAHRSIMFDLLLAVTAVSAAVFDPVVPSVILCGLFLWTRFGRKTKLPWWTNALLVLALVCVALTSVAQLGAGAQRIVDVTLFAALVSLLLVAIVELIRGAVTTNRSARRLHDEVELMRRM